MNGQTTFQWEQLARRQKIWIGACAVILVMIIAGLAWDSLRVRTEVWGLERQAAQAERDKDEALKKAADIAQTVKIREEELAKVVGKRDAKSQEVKTARDDVKSARDEYERAVRERRPDAPSTDQLCRELAALAHPCQPR